MSDDQTFRDRVRLRDGTLLLGLADRLAGVIALLDDAALTIDCDTEKFEAGEREDYDRAEGDLRRTCEAFYRLAERVGHWTVDGRVAAVRPPATEQSEGQQ